MIIKEIEYEEYVSINGLRMLEGEWINWQKSPIYQLSDDPFVFSIAFGTLSEMWVANYYWEEDKLSISNLSYSSDESTQYWVNSLEMAEMIVLSVIKGKNLEVMPLYEKKLNR